jgi:acetyltransferase-like isoleucine patch superfamily enzyme
MIRRVARMVVQLVTFLPRLLVLRACRIRIGAREVFLMKGVPFIRNRGTIVVEPGVRINSTYRANPIGGNAFCSFVVRRGGTLTIRRGARISNLSVVCWTSVTIGEDVFVGGDVRIFDTDFHPIEPEARIADDLARVRTAPVTVLPRAFIGTGAFILKGVTIGEESVVGAGAVVTRDIPAGEIWGGNPARFIRNVKTP